MHGLSWAHVADDELLAAMPAGHPMAKLKVGRSGGPWRTRT